MKAMKYRVREKRKLSSDELLDILLDKESIDLDQDDLDYAQSHREQVLFVNVLLKQIQRERHLKELHPPSIDEVDTKTIRSCRKCYFCSFVRTVGVDWYVYCSHPSRTGQNQFLKAGVNLSCWRPRKEKER